MRLNKLAVVAWIAVVVLSAAGCKSSSHSSVASPASNTVATETDADSASPETASSSPSAPASGSAPVSATSSPSTPASVSAATATQPPSGGAKCTDLTDAAASAALGKAVTIALDVSGSPLAGQTICNVTIANEVYPVQLNVNTSGGAQQYAADKIAFGPTVSVSGVGDEAFTSGTGIEVLAKGTDIQVVGPAGPIGNGNYTAPTALAKAMVAALP